MRTSPLVCPFGWIYGEANCSGWSKEIKLFMDRTHHTSGHRTRTRNVMASSLIQHASCFPRPRKFAMEFRTCNTHPISPCHLNSTSCSWTRSIKHNLWIH
ncbi:hypothetical protein M5D96_012061 [Drosophila gunungcola]|uniref:Uncharacterized protein n=1 Tax=Drosophila gunungcola TaxID=103775 RepID=A0A9P9YDX0_9MUSC|nr:hypothetical protein M5D96_012061 [Drosophila gunungcola]